MMRPRNRLLSLRMTEEEYQRLIDASAGQGARSVSEFARSALLVSAERASHSEQTGACLCHVPATLEKRLWSLEQEIARFGGNSTPDLSFSK